MAENNLKMTPTKTEALIAKSPRKRDDVIFHVANNIKPKRHLKYLGVWLDDKRAYNKHMRWVVQKAERGNVYNQRQNHFEIKISRQLTLIIGWFMCISCLNIYTIYESLMKYPIQIKLDLKI